MKFEKGMVLLTRYNFEISFNNAQFFVLCDSDYLKFLLGRGPLCGATGTFCFGLLMALFMGFKARVDSLLPELFCHLHAIIPRATSGCRDWASNPESLRLERYPFPSPAQHHDETCMIEVLAFYCYRNRECLRCNGILIISKA